MRGLLFYVTMMLTVFAYASPAVVAQDETPSAKEYQIKAAYLYNFVKFVEWPGAQALSATHSANICLMGEDPFGSALDIFKQASTPQLSLNVKHNISLKDIPRCHILFLGRSMSGEVPNILAHAKGHPVLTVSEIPGFADEGGVIEMVKVEKNIGLFSKDKINLRINLKTASEEGMRIDAQLLEIAAEVLK